MRPFIIVLLLCFSTLIEGAQPLALYLTWQHDPTQTMTVVWLTRASDEESHVEYLPEEELAAKWSRTEGECHAFPYCKHYLIHCTELRQLKPDTLYRFRLSEESGEHLFKTLPAALDKPVRFIEGGDCYHDTLEMLKRTNSMAASYEPDFVILGGDLAYAAKSSTHKQDDCTRWIDFLQAWTKTMVTPHGRLIPLLVAIGNHEVNGFDNQTPEQAQVFYRLFPLPEGKSSYSLVVGNYLTLVALDSGHSQPIESQENWLKEALETSPINSYRFIYYHVPAYPSVRSYRGSVCSAIRKHWLPILDQFSVDAVFEHHDHAYKRTHPLTDGRFDPNGIVYVGDGSWAAKPRKPHKTKNVWYLAKTAAESQFNLVTLREDRALFQAITSKGKVIDEHLRPRRLRDKVGE